MKSIHKRIINKASKDRKVGTQIGQEEKNTGSKTEWLFIHSM